MAQIQKAHLEEVIVLIPVYKEMLSAAEQASFKQCLKVLGKHPISLVAPAGLNLKAYHTLAPEGTSVKVSRLDPAYFKDTRSYSRLFVGNTVYKQFSRFRYLLIYQLDAWVFRDELLHWCKKGYDYIGAPWLSAPAGTKNNLFNLSALLKGKVGNGGFSLRRTEAHWKWSAWAGAVFRLFPKNEDVIWSLLVPFKKPSCRQALHFAFELEPRAAYQKTDERLPFGCHGWEKYDPDFWSEFITVKP